MSAWSIGSTSEPEAREASGNSNLKTFIDKLIIWIPGDVIALYVAGVAAIGVSDPQVWFLIVGIVLAPAVVILGSLTQPANRRPSQIKTRAALSATAMTIWSLSVPGSGWQEVDKVAQHPQTIVVISAILGLLFGLVASALVGENN